MLNKKMFRYFAKKRRVSKPVYISIFSVIFIVTLVIFATKIFQRTKTISSTETRFPPSTVIVQAEKPYAFKNTTNEFQTRFKSKATEPSSISFTNDFGEISFFTPLVQSFGKLNPESYSRSSGNLLTYPEIFPQVDLRYTISTSRLLEEFIIKDKSTANKITRIEQRAKTNLKYQENSDGSVTFTKNNKTVFTLPTPVLYELQNTNNVSHGIKYEIKKSLNQLIITKVITSEGLAWINDSKREFPIVIDLVIDNADTAANWVSSDTTNTVVTQETSIKQEGSGSVKVQTTSETASSTIDLLEYSSDTNAQAAYVTNSLILSGGTETTYSIYKVHKFTSSGIISVTNSGTADVLVVAGGGSGATGESGCPSGAGGAGGVLYTTGKSLSSGNITVTVGLGGQNSVFSDLTAIRGGNGGYSCNAVGGSGGSGGGSGKYGGGGGAGTAGQGYAGSGYTGAGGAGGGAGEIGGTDGNGYGGDGRALDITGTSTYYGGGGAGQGTSIPGGDGGGGASGGGAGVNGLGGGGGTGVVGGGGGGGGSGVVIFRYVNLTLQSYSEATIKTQGSYSLKGVSKATNSLNKTLTRTIASPINLTNKTSVKFDIRASRTGSNIKIGLHDSGGTTTEITPNITSADTFQTASLDISSVSNANKDDIDSIIITIVNADADNTFYIDNFVDTGLSINDTITLTKTATNLTGIDIISFWVRSSVAGSFYRFQFGETTSSEQTYNFTINSANVWEQKVWDISGISAAAKDQITKFAYTFTSNTTGAIFYFDYISTNRSPNTPTISSNFLHNKIKILDTTPEIRFLDTDPETDDLIYEISLDTDSSFPTETIFASNTSSGFINISTPSDSSPFNSGNTISYTFQTPLSSGTTYFYRIRALDPTGSNSYSPWSEIRSMTIDTNLAKNRWFETHADQFSTDTHSPSVLFNDLGNYAELNQGFLNMDGWEYRKPITITNSGSTLTNEDILFEIDTATLISSSKMQSDCDDIRFLMNDEATSISYWVEGGCNTTKTQVWIQYPSLPTGNTSIYMYYGKPTATNDEVSWAGNFVVLSTTSCPTGWTRVSAYDGLFPYGSATYGTTSTSLHNHFQASCNTGGQIGGTLNNGADDGSPNRDVFNASHTHAGAMVSVDDGTVDPPYIGLYFCSNPKLSYFTNSVAPFNSNSASLPSGFSYYSTLEGKYPKGNNGLTSGGSSTHTHTTTGGYNTGIASTFDSKDADNSSTPAIHYHTTVNGSTGTGNNDIPYYGVTYGQATSPTITSSGTNIISMSTVLPPFGWTRFSNLDSKYPLGAATAGTSYAGATHTHSVTINTGYASSTQAGVYFTGGSSFLRDGTHTHSCSATTPAAQALAPYNSTIFSTKKTNTATYAFGSEVNSVTIGILTSTHINISGFYSDPKWNKLEFNYESGMSITFHIMYDVTGTPTIVPDSALPGNSTGFTVSPVSLLSLSTVTYPIIYARAILSYANGNPLLYDWQISSNSAPVTPSLDFPADTSLSAPLLTVFKTTTTDIDLDYIRYKIHLCTDAAMTANCQTLDQTSSQAGWTGQDTETNTAYASGTQATYTMQTPLNPYTVYYWKTYGIDPGGSNTWSSTQTTPFSFTTNKIPETPSLDSPLDGAEDVSLSTVFKTTTTDFDLDYLRYKIIICHEASMAQNCQTIDQTSSQAGWTGQDTQTNTAYASGTQATHTLQSPLLHSKKYFWKSYATDPGGTNYWSVAQTTPFSFTTMKPPILPAPCTVMKSNDSSTITVNWTDHSLTENYYQVWKSTGGGLPVQIGGNLAPNTIQLVDSDIALEESYGYLIRGVRTDGTNTLYSEWCSAATSHVPSANNSLLIN